MTDIYRSANVLIVSDKEGREVGGRWVPEQQLERAKEALREIRHRALHHERMAEAEHTKAGLAGIRDEASRALQELDTRSEGAG